MTPFAIAIAAIAFPALAAAGVAQAIDAHVLPGYPRFAEQTARLAETADGTCEADALKPAYQDAFDAWMGVSHLRLGPVEDEGRALAIAFWPDTRNLTESTLRALIETEDPVIGTPEGFADVSVAGRGLLALERLLYDPAFRAAGDAAYRCRLGAAISADLARMAAAIRDGWRTEFAELLRTGGAEGNDAFLSEREANQALYTALTSALDYDSEQRIGRPLGSFDRPRPSRAEAWRSGRPLRNVILSLEALRELAAALADETPQRTLAAFDAALERARALDDPDFAGVETMQGRFEMEVLQQTIGAIRDAAAQEIGAALGVAAGFNAGDGD